ncbi:MAG: STAS domain-containing protein [Acidimicrobiales bacterium]
MSDQLPQEFRIEFVDDADACVVRVFGELDLVRADDVRDALAARDNDVVVVDLSHVEFIDSTGVSALLIARRALESSGRCLELRGAAGATRRVFEAIGLDDVLDD